MEQTRSRGGEVVDAPHPLEAMLTGALALEGAARYGRLNELNRALRTARISHAPAIARLLDDPRLAGLEDQDGEACRAVAVGALLGLGFPWALHVTPEDLAFARSRERETWDTGNRVSAIAVLMVAAGLGLLGLMTTYFAAVSSAHQGQMFLCGGLMAAYATSGMIAPFRAPRRRSLQRTAALGIGVIVLQGLLISSQLLSVLLFGVFLTLLLMATAWAFSFAMPDIEHQPGFR